MPHVPMPKKGHLRREELPSAKLRNELQQVSRFRCGFDTTARGLCRLSVTVENESMHYSYRQADDEGNIIISPITALMAGIGDAAVAELRSRGYMFPANIPERILPVFMGGDAQ